MGPYDQIYRCVLDGDEPSVLAACEELLKKQHRPLDILEQGLIPAINDLGELLHQGKIFVPQILLSAKAMQSAVRLLRPSLLADGKANNTHRPITVVIGTVQGDIHAIGKNLVGIMLESTGCQVIDLGVNVSAEKFVAAVHEHHASVVCISALLTSSMERMRQIVQRLQGEEFDAPIQIIVGGGPITPSFARDINATYGGSLVDTAQKAVPLICRSN